MLTPARRALYNIPVDAARLIADTVQSALSRGWSLGASEARILEGRLEGRSFGDIARTEGKGRRQVRGEYWRCAGALVAFECLSARRVLRCFRSRQAGGGGVLVYDERGNPVTLRAGLVSADDMVRGLRIAFEVVARF